jgi:hypothetical protein
MADISVAIVLSKRASSTVGAWHWKVIMRCRCELSPPPARAVSSPKLVLQSGSSFAGNLLAGNQRRALVEIGIFAHGAGPQ